MEEVLASIDCLKSDYSRHARAARVIAEEYFDAKRVLNKLLEKIVSKKFFHGANF